MENVLETQELAAGDLGGKFLIFMLNDRSYGISILSVNEIIGLLDITPVPKMPHFLRGVINLRGKIIPIIDLRLKLSMEEKEYDEKTCIVIVNATEDARQQVGLVVDMVSEVFDIPSENINPPLNYSSSEHGNFLDGIGKIKDKVIMLLNIMSIIDFEQIKSLIDENGRNE